MKALLIGSVLAALGVGFALGRAGVSAGTGAQVVSAQALPTPTFQRVQADPRELVPLGPGPGEGPGEQPGQQPGQGQQPQPGQQQGECTVLMMQDGQLYQVQPGQQPGQQPGAGDGPGNGRPGGDELIPLQPYQGPAIPGLPAAPDSEIKA